MTKDSQVPNLVEDDKYTVWKLKKKKSPEVERFPFILHTLSILVNYPNR